MELNSDALRISNPTLPAVVRSHLRIGHRIPMGPELTDNSLKIFNLQAQMLNRLVGTDRNGWLLKNLNKRLLAELKVKPEFLSIPNKPKFLL